MTEEKTLKNAELMSDVDLMDWRDFYRVAYGQARKQRESETIINYFRKAYGKIITEFEKRPDLDAMSWVFDDLDEGPVEQLRLMTEEEMKLWWRYSKSSQMQLGELEDAETLRSFFRNLDYEIDFKFGKHIQFVMRNVELMSSDEDLSGWTNFYRITYRQARKQGEPEPIINFLYVSYHEFNKERKERSHISYSAEEGLDDGPAEQLRLMTGEEAALWLRYSKSVQRYTKDSEYAEPLRYFFQKVTDEMNFNFIRYSDLVMRNIDLIRNTNDLIELANFYKLACGQAMKRGEAATVIDYLRIAYHEFRAESKRREHADYRFDGDLFNSVEHIKWMNDLELALWLRYSNFAQRQIEELEDNENLRNFFQKVDEDSVLRFCYSNFAQRQIEELEDNENLRNFFQKIDHEIDFKFGKYFEHVRYNVESMSADEDLRGWANFYRIAYRQARKQREPEIVINYLRVSYYTFNAESNKRWSISYDTAQVLDEGPAEQLGLMTGEELALWLRYSNSAQRHTEEHEYTEPLQNFFQKVDAATERNRN